MKKLVAVSLFIFFAATTAIIIAGLVFYQDSKMNVPVSPSPSVLADSSTAAVLSSQEIARHSTVSDCWLLISNKVYNLTGYLTAHPGGVQTISPYCGKEASQAFATKDTGNAHSANANNLLANYYVGDLGQKIGILPVTEASLPAENIATPSASLSPTAIPLSPVSGNTIALDAQEIGKHNTVNDCWLIINSKVYNVTSYFGAHPGGTAAISPYCGKDAVQAFNGLPHSSYANTLLASYFIGNLNQVADTQQIQKNIQASSQVTPPSGRGDDEDDD